MWCICTQGVTDNFEQTALAVEDRQDADRHKVRSLEEQCRLGCCLRERMCKFVVAVPSVKYDNKI